MKNRLLIFIFIFIPSFIYAQNYKKGYILANNGDTIRGYIDYKTDRINSGLCNFKENLNSDIQSFLPKDISGYRFFDEKNKEIYYVSKEINIDNTKQTVFVEYLLEGVMDLYYYPTKSLNYYLFEDEDGQINYITKQEDVIIHDKKGKPFSKEDTKYKGELKYMFRNIPTVAQMTDKVTFDRSSMIELTKKYHNMTCATGEKCIIFEGKGSQQVVKIKFSAYAGVTYISSYEICERIISARTYDLKKYSPVIGGQINLYAPRWSQSFSLIFDISVSQIKGDRPVFNNDELTNIYKLSSMTGSFKGGIRYTYPKGNYRSNIEIGYTFNKMFDNDIKFVNVKNGQEVIYDEYTADKYTGIYIAAGIDFKLKKENYIFCRLTYEKNWYRATGSHGIELFGAKIGYTF